MRDAVRIPARLIAASVIAGALAVAGMTGPSAGALAVLPVHHRGLRAAADPGVPGQPGAAGHAVGGHGLEGAQHLERLGVEPGPVPGPQTFLTWAKSQGIHVTLNIHSGISTSDPQLAQAEAIAGNSLASANCFSGPCQVWDWSQIPQAESNFSLQQSFEQQGTAFGGSTGAATTPACRCPALTPDSWINHLYTQEMLNQGERGFVLARIGSSYQSPGQVYAAGPWSDHRSAVHFTGDTWGTWNTLASQAELSQAEASVGQPYVSDDIGSFLGPPPGGDTNPGAPGGARGQHRLGWHYDPATATVAIRASMPTDRQVAHLAGGRARAHQARGLRRPTIDQPAPLSLTAEQQR